MQHRATLPVLVALIAAHVVLAVLYLVQTPYRTAGVVTINPSHEKDIGAPDERQHANNIRRLIKGQGFAVFNPKDPNLYENYQAHQPPLYYLMASAWARGFDVQDVESKRDGSLLRLLNVLVGAAGVAGVFFLAKWAYHREWIALTATGIAALLPMNVALSSAISNDPLLIALCTWALAFTALAMREGWTTRRAVAVGLLTGLALLTKTTAVALLPTLLLAALLTKPKAFQVGTVLLVSLGLALPWWVRNQVLYGDPLAMGAFSEAFVGSAQKTLFTEQIIPKLSPGENPNLAYWIDWVGFWTARSFLGVFGYMDVWLTQSGMQRSTFDENRLYWVAILVFAVGLVGWIVSWRDPQNDKARRVRIVNLVFFLVILAQFVLFNNRYFQAQARYLLPALGPIACGLALGYHELAHRRKLVPLVAMVVFLLMVNVFALVRLGPQFEARIQPQSRLP
ncbi:MAG TPA: glycosyltransferase family 39 protein [Fimbriimonas sp.]